MRIVIGNFRTKEAARRAARTFRSLYRDIHVHFKVEFHFEDYIYTVPWEGECLGVRVTGTLVMYY